MITITRATQYSNAPILVQIETDRIATEFTLIGSYTGFQVPGNRLIALCIQEAELYQVRIHSNGREYTHHHGLRDVSHITITDGFELQCERCVPGYAYRPQRQLAGRVAESGKLFIFPGF